MKVALKYGRRKKVLHIPQKADIAVLKPAKLPMLNNVGQILERVLTHPIGCEPFENMVQAVEPKKVSIAVPDETRPVPIKEILPILVRRIHAALPGLDPEAVTVVIGGGLHPPMDREGIRRIIPSEIAGGCRFVAHDAIQSKMVDFGVTRRGTPVRINAEYAEADLKIVIGQIDPHQFVGFTGGSKGVAIGCAAAESIAHNHSLMFDEMARIGILEGNPVREDLNEAGEMIGIDLAINVVLDADMKVVQLLAGLPAAVLTEGTDTCAKIFGVAIDNKFDIVIASCGGYPKDICLYQSQKGLNLASQAVKDGGKILLLAACPQGVGDDIYFDYACQFATPNEVLKDFEKMKFKMGAHKAYLFSRTLIKYDVAVVSDLDPDILRQCHLNAAHPSLVIRKWLQEFDGRPRLAVVPNANTTYFYYD